MTLEETRNILKILKVNYRASFTKMSKEESQDLLNLWHEMFKDDDARLVALAVKSIITTDSREFYPNIGRVKEEMYKLLNHDEMSEQEAWNLVLEASKNGIHGSKEEFAKLPKVIQSVLGSPDIIREYAMMDIESLNTVVASNFMRSYKVRAAKFKEMDMLPNDIKSSLGTRSFIQIESKKEGY